MKSTILANSSIDNHPHLDRTRSEILQSTLTALSEGRISDAVREFDDQFTFIDHALNLEFTDKAGLAAFFHKSRDLFPDAEVEALSTLEQGNLALAEWTLTATEIVGYGSLQLRRRISCAGVSIVRIQNHRIVEWCDYYDELKSRRVSLAAHFTEWIEL